MTVLLCQSGFTNTASAATYYLDAVNGNDTNPGTSEQPWKTLARALPNYNDAIKVAFGDIVKLRDGNYGYTVIQYSAPHLGSSWSDKITYTADDGHDPVIERLNIIASRYYLEFNNIKIRPTQESGADGIKIYYAESLRFIDLDFAGIWNTDFSDMDEKDSSGYDALDTGFYISGGTAEDLTDDITIQGCEISQVIQGINLSGYIGDDNGDIVIKDNHIYTTARSQIVVDATNAGTNGHILIEGNHLHDFYSFYTGVDMSHASGIAIQACNVTVRNNIVHATGSTAGIATYQYGAEEGVGFSDILIENNLVYDNFSQYAIRLYDISDTGRVIFRNNTIVGWHSEAGSGASYYHTVLHIRPFGWYAADGFDPVQCSGLGIYNNIVVGAVFFDDSEDANEGLNSYSEDFNYFYSAYDDGAYLTSHDNTVIVTDSDYNDVFVSGFFVNPDFTPAMHRNDLNDEYKLAVGSPAINFGDTTKAPSTDINRITRGSVPDAGCYEYVSSGTNNAPVLASIGNKSVSENSTLSFSVSATDADGDTITYLASGLPSGATFASQTFSWTPSYSQAGSYQVTFTASDGTASDSETITITASNTNRTPVLVSIGNRTVNENDTLSFSVSATDADGDNITYSAETLPVGAAFGSRTFSWTPSYSQAGSYQLTFTVSDGSAQDSETISITVSNVNRAPVLDAIGNKSVYASDSLTFAVSATDPDGDTVTYSVSGLPSGATFTTQTFSWTPSQSQAGSYQVTFSVSDGGLEDSETITITVNAADTTAPSVTGLSPAADSIQQPLNTLIILHITDSGKGVAADSVVITVNNSIVYTSDTADYSSSSGRCRRTGTKADYTYTYQADEIYDFDRTVAVTVNAADLAGNVMQEYSYSFATEMRSFGKNKKVNSGSDNTNKGEAKTRSDSSGNIWTVWQGGQAGSRNIYVGRLTAGAENFGSTVQLTNNAAEQCNPDIAIDDSDKIYVVWQDNRRENWDIYISTCVDGINWSAERPVTDSNDNETSPAVVVDHSVSSKAYIVWQDDRAGNGDIYVASSTNDFLSKSVSRITSDGSNQSAPAAAVGADNTVYVVWTDTRGGSNDIYGAASNDGPWANVAIVNNAASQSAPSIATESAGSILHLLWVDDSGGNYDIYYAASSGLPSSPLGGSSIIDDSSGADQSRPAITTTGSTGAELKVFAVWRDERNIAGASTDSDVYFSEVSSSLRTNVFVGDDGTNAEQSGPAIGTGAYGHPYLVWADDRNSNTDIYYAASTFVESEALQSGDVAVASGATVGTEPAAINSADDVSVVIPGGAYSCDVRITISRVKNPAKVSVECLSIPYEFGPSGIDFTQPVTITIPYEVSSSGDATSAYWYNPLTGALSQQGITDIETIEISGALCALRFKTTHFTQFVVGGVVVGAVAGGGGGGGGGGGCSLYESGDGSIAELFLPYIALAAAMVILRLRDVRKRRMRNATKLAC